MNPNPSRGEMTTEQVRALAKALREVYRATKDDIAVFAPQAYRNAPNIRFIDKIRFFGDDVYLTCDQVEALARFLKNPTREQADRILRRPHWSRDQCLAFELRCREIGAYAVFREAHCTSVEPKTRTWLASITYHGVHIVPTVEEAIALAQAQEPDALRAILDAAHERTVRGRQEWEATLNAAHDNDASAPTMRTESRSRTR